MPVAQRLLSRSLLLVLLLIFIAPSEYSQVRTVPEVPRVPIGGPIGNPNPNTGTQNLGLKPGLGTVTSAPNLNTGTAVTSYQGNAGQGYSGTSSTSFVPDETSTQVQAYLDRLVAQEMQRLPAIKKAGRTR